MSMNIPPSSPLGASDSNATFNQQLIQSGPSLPNMVSEYPSLNSHGAQSSQLANSMPQQFTEEENDILAQKDTIFKKVNDLFALLK